MLICKRSLSKSELLTTAMIPDTIVDIDGKVRAKTWIKMLIVAVEDDRIKDAPKCFNRCCIRLRPRDPRAQGWRKHTIRGRKTWLCGACSGAYNARQYCEFCSQVYLEDTLETTALDGKTWAQCEECGRWGHVECLQQQHGKTKEEVMADSFKYVCGGCRGKSNKKRARINEGMGEMERGCRSGLRRKRTEEFVV
eukprot:TRINITY_DN782_c0_g3_i1.p2 TRINITY_DN782_c0_g3~~TRINITY_DN782_c0_g3_i1.p2  ORF type:complete len:195 (+),score=31.55 TRINITY_DN782_c0_g3_i1:501-1085(+)